MNAPQLDLQCGTPQVVLFVAHEPTTAPSSGEPALQVTLHATSPASLGTTYEYTVTLTNHTAATVSLLPCPGYTEGLTGVDGSILSSRTYLLNCQSVGQLAPGASATFEMRFPIPATLRPGPAKFWWVMQVPDGPAGGQALQLS